MTFLFGNKNNISGLNVTSFSLSGYKQSIKRFSLSGHQQSYEERIVLLTVNFETLTLRIYFNYFFINRHIIKNRYN